MRTRNMTYSDYGISVDRAKELLSLCENGSIPRLLIEEAIKRSGFGVPDRMVECLTSGKGYYVLDKKEYIPCKSDDFYAYKRKSIAILDWLLEEQECQDELKPVAGTNSMNFDYSRKLRNIWAFSFVELPEPKRPEKSVKK